MPDSRGWFWIATVVLNLGRKVAEQFSGPPHELAGRTFRGTVDRDEEVPNLGSRNEVEAEFVAEDGKLGFRMRGIKDGRTITQSSTMACHAEKVGEQWTVTGLYYSVRKDEQIPPNHFGAFQLQEGLTRLAPQTNEACGGLLV